MIAERKEEPWYIIGYLMQTLETSGYQGDEDIGNLNKGDYIEYIKKNVNGI